MNKSITISIPHRLTQEEARTRLANGLTELKQKYAGSVAGLEENWSGNLLSFRLTAVGQSITGRAEVLAEAVKLDIDLPWLIAAMAEKLRPKIEAEGRRMLEKK